jgi:hypothetical protein
VSARFASFTEFYPFYLSEHRNATCRKLHFTGSALVLALVGAAVLDAEPLWLLAVPIVGYGFAVGRAFRLREEPARDLQLPALELHGRLGHVLAAALRESCALKNEAPERATALRRSITPCAR